MEKKELKMQRKKRLKNTLIYKRQEDYRYFYSLPSDFKSV